MMTAIEIAEAETHLEGLVEKLQSGEENEIVILVDGEAAARLISLRPSASQAAG